MQGIGGIALDKAGSVFLAGDFGQLYDGSVERPASAALMPEDAANVDNISSCDLRVFLTHLNTDLK